MAKIEAWLSGPLEGTSPLVAPVIYALRQTEEDLAKWTAGLTDERIWSATSDLAPVGFQLKHIAGSIDRLLTYAKGESLSEAQMATLRKETEPSGALADLLAAVSASIRAVEEYARTLDPAHLTDGRGVGRKQLPATVIGLLFHLAEHSQRHAGQAIATVRVLRAGTAHAAG
ncbi:MAG: DinB family protein [Bryobacterales bacterium]|nr:DinB family protein [Bryobacterales bacterium]